MTWNEIKAQIRSRHVHAIVKSPDELRFMVGFGIAARDRIALAVRRKGERTIVTALVDLEHHLDLDAAARFATSWNISLVSVGNRICVRAVLDPKHVEDSLQSIARTALRMRYAACRSLTLDLETNAYFL